MEENVSSRIKDRELRKRIVTGPQPNPKKGKLPVREYIEEAIVLHQDHAFLPVFNDCLLKLEAGEEKYWSPLEIDNGRCADLDAYQDILDAINYQIQSLMEAKLHGKVDTLRARAEEIVATLQIAVRIEQRLVDEGVLGA